MRSLRTVLLAAAVTSLAGCEWMRQGRDKPLPRPSSAAAITKREPAELVTYLNQQADALRTVSYSDVVLSATENGTSHPTLRDCSLDAAQPRNFRLMASTFVTSGELDMGSNDREFWMYVKRLPGDNYFFCSHEDFARRAVSFPIPFDPDWVMMALGMSKYDPNGRYESDVKVAEGQYILREQTATRRGDPITKVTVFNAEWDSGRRPAVRWHGIYDRTDKLVCSAEIKSADPVTRKDNPAVAPAEFVQVPSHVVLKWPQQQFVMELKLRGVRVNETIDADRMATLFNRPRYPGAKEIDLARYEFRPTSYRGQFPAETRFRRR